MRSTGVVAHGEPAAVFDDHLTGVYGYAARNGAIQSICTVATDLGLTMHEVNAAVDQLIELRLLRVDQDADGWLVPVDPEIAAALSICPMEREIYQRREMIAQIRGRIETFRRAYAHTGKRGASEPASVESLTGSMEVRGFLKIASDACRREILVLQAGREDTEDLDFPQTSLALLERGVAVRIVCQHRSRADLSVRTKIKKLTDAGAVVRTVSHLPRGAVVFDRSLAVLCGPPDGADTTAASVRNDEVVRFLLDMFDHLWDAGTPFDSVGSGYAEVVDDLQQTIARLMARGFTDEVVARKLGISVRTCRRHIAALLVNLDAVSRFQAGAQAARRCLVDGS